MGGLIPIESGPVLRLHAPQPGNGDWWDEYRQLFDMVAAIGARHTATPDHARFAVWEGHGFDVSNSTIAWRTPPVDDDERRARETLVEHHRLETARRNARIGPALSAIPRVDLGDRVYYLLHGSLSGLSGLRYPDDDGWRNPDLVWPDDRSWFAATDVDFWSLFVAGTTDFIDELVRNAPTPTQLVDRDKPLPIED